MLGAFALAFTLLLLPVKDSLLNEEQFTQLFADSISARLPEAQVTVDAILKVTIKLSDKRMIWSNLHNAYSLYQYEPLTLNDIIERNVAARAISASSGFLEGLSTENIVPVVRHKDFYQQMVEQGVKGVSIPLNEELALFFAVDDSLTIRYLIQSEFEKLETTLDILEIAAVFNLERILPEMNRYDIGKGAFMLTAGGDYESSLLLFDYLWMEGSFPVKGDYVVAVPAKDVLLITGLDDSLGIVKLRENVARLDSAFTSILSKALFVRRNGSWEVLETPTNQSEQ